MNTPDALLPCPFCGGEARSHFNPSCDCCGRVSGVAHCRSCPASVDHFKTEADAITAWNRRAGQAHTDGLVAGRQAIVADLVDLYQRRVQSRKGKHPNNNDQFLMAIAQRIAGVSPLEDPLTAWNRRAGQAHTDGLVAANRLIVDLAEGLNALGGRWWELSERLGIPDSEAMLMSDRIERARATLAAAKG